MRIYTETDFYQQSQHSVFRLKNLYMSNPDTFFQLQDYLPLPTYINHRESFHHKFFNLSFLNLGDEIHTLFQKGMSYLPEISDVFLLNRAKAKAKELDTLNDHEKVGSYLQCITLNNKPSLYYTNKILLDEDWSLNTSFFFKDYPLLEKLLKELVPEGKEGTIQWQRFQTLTKSEKKILKLLAEGNSNEQVSNILFITKSTVQTHRKNIYKKLDVANTVELVKASYALELFC